MLNVQYQIAQLYQPLAESISDFEEDEEDDADSTQLLSLRVTHAPRPSDKTSRLANIWDEREELFESAEFDNESSNEIGSSGKVPSANPQIVVSRHS